MYVKMVTRTMYKINVSQIERKEKDTSNPHYIPQCALSPSKNLLC